MKENAKRALEGLTGKKIVMRGSPGTGSLGDDSQTIRLADEIDFAIVMANSGRVFYTNGWEDTEKLEEAMGGYDADEGEKRYPGIFGSYDPAASLDAPVMARIYVDQVEAIIDFRAEE